MSIYKHEEDLVYEQSSGHRGGILIDEVNGAENGFCMGISCYETEVYGNPGIHDDQEGFYVIEGSGMAKVGEEEFPICPGTAFIAPKGVSHSIKKGDTSKPVKVLWCHGAV